MVLGTLGLRLLVVDREFLVLLLELFDLGLQTMLNLELSDSLFVNASDRVAGLTQLRLPTIGHVAQDADATEDLTAFFGQRRIVAIKIDLTARLTVRERAIA